MKQQDKISTWPRLASLSLSPHTDDGDDEQRQDEVEEKWKRKPTKRKKIMQKRLGEERNKCMCESTDVCF